MTYKSHPHYDESDAKDWLSLSDNPCEFETEHDKKLINTLRVHKPRLCHLALEEIRSAAGDDYVAQRPYPDVNEFSYFPIGNCGYRVYVEYFFFQRPDENSPDSDCWWVIINCPDAVISDSAGRPKEYIIGLGWFV